MTLTEQLALRRRAATPSDRRTSAPAELAAMVRETEDVIALQRVLIDGLRVQQERTLALYRATESSFAVQLEIEAVADGVQAAPPRLSREAAMQLALTENSELYNRYSAAVSREQASR